MRVAASGKYWIRINNLITGKSMLTSYDGFMTLAQAREEFFKCCEIFERIDCDDCYIFVIDKNNEVKALKRVGGNA